MPSIVNTNMLSLTTQRQMNKAQTAQQNAMTRLSSGLRINGAKDDAAGLSISNRMSSQITGLTQAVRNANDGISLAQTAEGGLTEINTNLQRMRELAVQSANSTNTASDRAALQQETSQLLSEIQRVATQTNFNGINLLDGSFQNKAFQIGANAGQTTNISVSSATVKDLGSSATSAVTGRGADASTGDLTSNYGGMKEGDVVINGVGIGASVKSDDGVSYLQNDASAIAKAAAFNRVSTSTGVTASVNANEVEGASMAAGGLNPGDAGVSGRIHINGFATDTVTATSDRAGTRKSVVAAINAISGRTGVTAVDTESDTGGVKLVAADGRNIALGVDSTDLTSAATGLNVSGDALTVTNDEGTPKATYTTDASDPAKLAGYQVFKGSITLSSTKSMTIEQGKNGTSNITHAGLSAGNYEAQKAVVSTKQFESPADNKQITSGDFRINGILVGGSDVSGYDKSSIPVSQSANSAIAKAAAVNAISQLTGVTATANTTIVNGAAMTAQEAGNSKTGKLNINGVSTSDIVLNDDNAKNREAVVKAINAISGQTGVHAIDTHDDIVGTGVRLEASDGRNVSVWGKDLTKADTGVNFGDDANGQSPTVYTGSISLSSTKAFSIERGTSDNDTMKTLGLQVGSYGGGRTGQSLESIDISTVDGATAAIVSIDNAISSVDNSRVNLGAYQNRFTSTVSALQSTTTNLTAARSRIQDADFAAESAEMSRASILQQAGTAMLAQANASSQGVLSLLR